MTATGPKPTLIGLGYSPWTRRAVWALDHHRIAFDYSEHVPMLGEPLLRLRAGRGAGRRRGGPVSVPLLITPEGKSIGDSWEIALWADAHAADVGAGTAPLVPDAHGELVRRWHERAERLSAAGRALSIHRTLHDKAAMIEQLPRQVPGFARGHMGFLAAQGARFLARKYGADLADLDAQRAAMVEVVAELRAALATGDGAHLVRDEAGGLPTWADVVCALSLQFVQPHQTLVKMGPATRQAWTTPEAVDAQVLAWRDQVIARKPQGR